MYDRAALILDGEDHPLGELSLALITLGLRPLYATELDELVLLSREYRRQVGAVLMPSEDVPERLSGVRKHVLEPLGLGAAALVPVGPALDPELRRALKEEGVRYRLPTEHAPHELRFVVGSALSTYDTGDLRLDPRVPCDFPVSVESEHRTVDGGLTDISIGGAFVTIAHPFPVDSTVRLLFVLEGQPARVQARVRWGVDARAPAWRDRGMGVEFVDPDDALREGLEGFVGAQKRRFRL